MPRYIIVRNTDLFRLEAEVNAEVAKGYKPSGDLVAVHNGNILTYLQPMFKE